MSVKSKRMLCSGAIGLILAPRSGWRDVKAWYKALKQEGEGG